jgi:hypothetical protein
MVSGISQLRPYKLTGIHNTLFYRKMKIKADLLSQLQTEDTNFSVPRITDYGPLDCADDWNIFSEWQEKEGWGNRTVPGPRGANEPLMCWEYSLYMASLNISNDSLGPFPSEDEISSIRR